VLIGIGLYEAWKVNKGHPLLRALAHAGAVLNLFNLVPAFSLDGARGLDALALPQRWMLVVVIGGALAFTDEGMLWPVLILAALRALSPKAPEKLDHVAFAVFAALIVGLSLLARAAKPA